jgi:GntR family transcriptional regulator, transcriptional repressor for pyruvate dehydrogenase complex
MNAQGTADYLTTIDTRSLVDKVEMNLIDFFIKKEFQPGDTIPKEIELANAMGVSRTVIRESLTRLKTLGIIESVKHKGTIIKSPDLSVLLGKSMIPHILDNSTLKDIFELRLVIEIGMADLIFHHITPKDIEELEQIINNEPEKSDNVLFDIDHEIRFHGKLYEITKNQTLKKFQKILLPVFNYIYDSGLIKKPIQKKKHVSHQGLVDVLKNGTPDKFRAAMRNHLENHFQRLYGE